MKRTNVTLSIVLLGCFSAFAGAQQEASEFQPSGDYELLVGGADR